MPPDAQVHLLNAQRELLMALTITLEHHLRQQRAARQDGDAPRRPHRVDIE